MTLVEFITSWTAIITAAFLSAVFAYLLFFRLQDVLNWEAEHLWSRYDALKARIKRFIRKRLKSNARFMAWLNKPAKHGKPDEDWIVGQVKVFGDMWR